MTPQDITSIHLVGPGGNSAHTIALEAIKRAFPELAVVQSRDFDEAVGQPAANGRELLVLLAPRSGDIHRAAATNDPRGLSRWSIIARGASPKGSSSPFLGVATEDWNPATLAHALGTASTLHELQRENARLRGDLRTISRRLAHDLRTPLNCISTASEALNDPETGADSTTTMFARSISESVNEAVALVERVSSVMKATANSAELQPVTMEEIVWGTLQRLETRIGKAGAVVTKPKSWPAVVGVPAWIELIWMNLVLNSLQHAGPQPRIELGWERVDNEYRFWIRDSGKGVAPENRSRLFHPLDRLNELNAPRGYGLAIVHRLVELQGGRCGYDPEPAPGGSFFFTLRPA